MFIISFWIICQSITTFAVNYVFQISQPLSQPSSDSSTSIIPSSPILVILLNYLSIYLIIGPIYLYTYWKTGSLGFYTLDIQYVKMFSLYAIISCISDLANLYCLTGINISSYLILINLYVPFSCIFAKWILKIEQTCIQWLLLILVILVSIMFQCIIEPDILTSFSWNQTRFYLALLATITLDCINMSLLTKYITNGEDESYQRTIYTLGCMYAFCSVICLCFFLITSIFWFPATKYTQWIYLYCILYAVNTLIYVYICKRYDPVIFTLSGVLSIIWSFILLPQLITSASVLACFVLALVLVTYIKSKEKETREEIPN